LIYSARVWKQTVTSLLLHKLSACSFSGLLGDVRLQSLSHTEFYLEWFFVKTALTLCVQITVKWVRQTALRE